MTLKLRIDPHLLEALASDKRDRNLLAKALQVGKIKKRLIKDWHARKPVGLTEDLTEWILTAGDTALNSGIESGIFTDSLIAAQQTLYGDPMTMAVGGFKHHALPYHNPTHHRINIFPLGMAEHTEDGKVRTMEWVEPGDIVHIPHLLTVGKRYSSLNGVAPQLRPIARTVDTELDISPLTYAEWCATCQGPFESKCCKRMVVWSIHRSSLECPKCGKQA